jgi:hypothetical protein
MRFRLAPKALANLRRKSYNPPPVGATRKAARLSFNPVVKLGSAAKLTKDLL